MDILRPPPGQDDEAPPPPRNPFLRFFFAALFLLIGMLVFFVGGVVVRNPELPNVLLDQIVRHFQGSTGSSASIITSTNPTGSQRTTNTTQTPPPTPTTGEEYVKLMNYDENVLSSDEQKIVSILNQMVPSVLVGSPPTERVSQEILPQINTFKPGDDGSRIRSAIQECRDQVSAAVRRCQDAALALERNLVATGMPSALAHDTAQVFARRPLTKGTVYWPAEFNQAWDDVVALVDILSKNGGKWTRTENGGLSFASLALSDQYNTAGKDLNSALVRATYGSAAEKVKTLPPPKTVNDYLNLISYDENTLPQDQRVVAQVLNQTTHDIHHLDVLDARVELPKLFNDQIQSRLEKLEPGADVSEIRKALQKCRSRMSGILQFYQQLPEKLAAQLVAAGVADSLAHQVSETFAQRNGAQQNTSWATKVNDLGNTTSHLVDLLAKNPSKWKRDSKGKFLSSSPEMIDQLNAANRDLKTAVKALDGN